MGSWGRLAEPSRDTLCHLWPTWRWVQLVYLDQAAFEDHRIKHSAHVNIQKASLVVADGFESKSPPQMLGRYNADMAPIYALCHTAECLWSRQLLEPSPSFLKLISGREVDDPPENPLNALAEEILPGMSKASDTSWWDMPIASQ